MANAYNFKGDGSEFIIGIPARSLTAEDVGELDAEDRLALASHVKNGGKLYAEGAAIKDVPEARGTRAPSGQTSADPQDANVAHDGAR